MNMRVHVLIRVPINLDEDQDVFIAKEVTERKRSGSQTLILRDEGY
jgi:hypothetical protein